LRQQKASPETGLWFHPRVGDSSGSAEGDSTGGNGNGGGAGGPGSRHGLRRGPHEQHAWRTAQNPKPLDGYTAPLTSTLSIDLLKMTAARYFNGLLIHWFARRFFADRREGVSLSLQTGPRMNECYEAKDCLRDCLPVGAFGGMDAFLAFVAAAPSAVSADGGNDRRYQQSFRSETGDFPGGKLGTFRSGVASCLCAGKPIGPMANQPAAQRRSNAENQPDGGIAVSEAIARPRPKLVVIQTSLSLLSPGCRAASPLGSGPPASPGGTLRVQGSRAV